MAEPEKPGGPEEQQSGGAQKGIDQHFLVEILRPDPSQPPVDVVKLIGFIGRDVESGYLRVYFSPSLDHHMKVAEADVVHILPRGPSEGEFSSSVIYVRRQAKLEETRAVSIDQKQAEFLRGELVATLRSWFTRSGMLPGTWPRARRGRVPRYYADRMETRTEDVGDIACGGGGDGGDGGGGGPAADSAVICTTYGCTVGVGCPTDASQCCPPYTNPYEPSVCLCV